MSTTGESTTPNAAPNHAIHIAALSATKTGDGLVDPKLVLAWLLGALGAPAFMIGLLVPVREALALLPQLFMAPFIKAMPVRKWAWAVGSFIQGLMVVGMAATAVTLEGAVAGWTIIGLLATFATARSVCSASYKDVLAKTVPRQERGSVTGAAGSIAAGLVLAFGIGISLDLFPLSMATVSLALALAGVLWTSAALLSIGLDEEKQPADDPPSKPFDLTDQFSLLRDDPQLRRFIAVRGLLTATALAPPFLVALSGSNANNTLTNLGPFVIASSVAAMVSSYVWGWLSDQSSRLVLGVAGIAAASILALTGTMASLSPVFVAEWLVLPAALFALMIAYQGVRLGRSTHLVDMATPDTRAAYTALSNTAIGILLLIGGAAGVVADIVGIPALLLVFSVMCVLASMVAFGLDDVQQRKGQD